MLTNVTLQKLNKSLKKSTETEEDPFSSFLIQIHNIGSQPTRHGK